MECVTFILEEGDSCHREQTVTTWGYPEKLLALSHASSSNYESFFKLQGDSTSQYRHVINVQQDCIVSMNWHQGILSFTDQVVTIVLRDHGIALEKSLHENELDVLSLSKNINFKDNLVSPPYDFTIEIHHSEPILYRGKGHLDLTVVWSESKGL
ncbi:hypothetical protein GKA54_14405 [Vibrio parahaemolyticus]|uniref:hypothetical protein n=1 Tax=Vibrio parahaemolyticus TaxID=670 RepID=UPI00061B201F|nr:hypothetical protein [Vibrio parahaemolyticus]EGQ8146188.1 hypothetical protein [Vibrio parahaemolyticus]EGQ8340081.1 hypothetical protein [Vibrio parahaemolyticus]EGQ8372820.1 hypothetical protein [Vibrio parahaemolyticus]EGQ8725069.1 hypothetical protein [Vibrio parahaemolyticus]EGQ8764431.1 hypothetical protein [Vibrio parahaemolyticus]